MPMPAPAPTVFADPHRGAAKRSDHGQAIQPPERPAAQRHEMEHGADRLRRAIWREDLAALTVSG